jgi:hypothetical protein
MMGEIEEFLRERNEMLLACDIDRSIAFWAKHSPDRPFPNREAAEAGLHKARTAVRSLPREERLRSKRWLDERGMSSWDDGDL